MAPKKSDQRLNEGRGFTISRYAQDAVRRGVFRRAAEGGHDNPARSADNTQDLSSSDDETLTTSTVNSEEMHGQGGAALRGEDHDRDHGSKSSRPDTGLAFWTTARGKQLEGRVMVALCALVEGKLAEMQPATVQRVMDEVLPELQNIVAEVMDREEEDEWIRCG